MDGKAMDHGIGSSEGYPIKGRKSLWWCWPIAKWKRRVNSGVSKTELYRRASIVRPNSFVAKTYFIMNDINTAVPPVAQPRPTLLTVVCVIAFILGAWGIFSGVKQITQDSAVVLAKAQADMEQARADLGDNAEGMAGRILDSAMEITEKAAANAVPIGIAGIILALISLFGVWQMWNLKKSGFWLYVLAAIGGLIVPLVFLGGSMLALFSVGFGGFVSLIFIILFAVNLKYMH